MSLMLIVVFLILIFDVIQDPVSPACGTVPAFSPLFKLHVYDRD